MEAERSAARAPLSWGAAAEDRASAYPCDSLLDQVDHELYRAVTIDAPLAHCFRWLCQLRVAPYSYDWIDNGGRQSPRELDPELTELVVGQRMMRIFRLVDFRVDDQLTMLMDDPRALQAFGEVGVTYALRAVGATRSRLIAKLVVRYPRTFSGRIARRWLPWGDLVMMRKQLLTLKRLAEASLKDS